MADNSFNFLIDLLHDHEVSYDRDAIKSVFDNPDTKPSIQTWIRKTLSPETLLTKDEAALYATLSKSGEAETLVNTQDLSVIRGLNEQEIQDAIGDLRRSTTAIEKQTESLRYQQKAMSALIKTNTRASDTRSQTEKTQQGKWRAEAGHISAAVYELSQSLKYRSADLEQQCKASDSQAKQTIDGVLKSDDKLLSSLQKLAGDLDPGRPEDGAMVSRIRELCAKLIKHTVEGVRTKLDRIYLQELKSTSEPTNGHDLNGQEIIDLQEELESLYSEILPVAQMSAEQQYLQPALREIATRGGRGKERSVEAVKYISGCLDVLMNRIQAILERTEEYQCYKMALQTVIDAAKRELLSADVSSTDKAASPTKPNTQRRRKSSSSQSPVRVRNTRRRSSGHMDEDIEPEQQLVRNLGISLPAGSMTDQSRLEILERALSDRMTKLEGHATSLQSTTESSISSHLLDVHTTLQLLEDCLLEDSFNHEVPLIDPGIYASVISFEEDIQVLQRDADGVSLQKLQSKNVHREELVGRWAR